MQHAAINSELKVFKGLQLLTMLVMAHLWIGPPSIEAFDVTVNASPRGSMFCRPFLVRSVPHYSIRTKTTTTTTTTLKNGNMMMQDKGDDFVAATSIAPIIDVDMFLTQRCIQSFMVLLASVHDVHTLNWLDDFTQPVNFCFRDTKNTLHNQDSDDDLLDKEDPTWLANDKRLTNSRLLSYHGTDAMNTTRFPTWESYFIDLLDLPLQTLTIQTNPLVTFGNKLAEFDVDIHPPRLCARMIAVREQIAREWVHDLEAIGKIGFDIFYSYWETIKEKSTEGGGSTNNFNGQAAFERPSKLFLDPRYDQDLAPSPLRKLNYDLLNNLATQEAIHRVLEQGISVEQDADGIASTSFLRQFYAARLQSHFNDGISVGRADDFLEELMLCVPQMIKTPQSSCEFVIVNPVTIAEIILKTRENVAKDWQEVMKNVPDQHTNIRKQMLSKMMAQ